MYAQIVHRKFSCHYGRIFWERLNTAYPGLSALRTNISTLSRSCSIDLFTLFRESDTGIFVSFSVSETTCTESLMNGFEDGAVGGEVGLFDEDESTGLN